MTSGFHKLLNMLYIDLYIIICSKVQQEYLYIYIYRVTMYISYYELNSLNYYVISEG